MTTTIRVSALVLLGFFGLLAAGGLTEEATKTPPQRSSKWP